MQIDLSRFRETFFQETEEHLARMEAELLGLEESADRPELLHSIFRSAHSIKGASGSFGFDDLGRFTHALESLLDRLRGAGLELSRERVDLLLRSVDALKGLLESARRGAAPPAEAQEVLARLIVAQREGAYDPGAEPRLRGEDLPAPPTAAARYRIRFAPSPDLFRQGMDPVLVLRQLGRVGQVEEIAAELSQLPPLEALDPESCHLAWNLRLVAERGLEEIRDVFAFVEDGSEIAIAKEQKEEAQPGGNVRAAATPAVRDVSSIRVATEKVDKLIDLVGELVIAQSMATEILNNFTPARLAHLQEAFAGVERYTRELQERVMSVRMLPIGNVFSRFPRLVRDLAAATGKQIAFETTGEETELDKGVVERMSDPLTHLVRNAVDHGLEPPEERVRAGKPAQGLLRLRAYHQGGNVIVEVTDDGRGLDLERIRRKAVERGLIAEDYQGSEAQIQALIFEPGFSTAETVSDLSGRGVGMDVVKKSVEALNGVVSVASRPGQGTSVRIKLPLTLAILDGLLVRVGGETYVLPLVSILESLQPRRGDLSAPGGRGEVVLVRGEPVPLVRLHRLFGVAGEAADPSCGLVAIAEHQGQRLALLVDELLGQQQVVIKTLETHFHKVEGVVGATILGDGRAALILDIAGLAQMARNAPEERRAA